MTAAADLAALLGRPEWMERAACKGTDPDLFFPSVGDTAKPFIKACEPCPVRDECLEWGLHEKFGVWGGLTERERRIIRTKRRRSRGDCGTDNGYKGHVRHSEPACDDCKAAHALYTARRRAS